MHLRGKNIIQPGVSRTPQTSSAKLIRVPDALLDTPFSGILSYLDAKDSTHARINLSTSCVTLYRQTERTRKKQVLEQLVQAMLENKQSKVSSILHSYPLSPFENLEADSIVESRFTWLRYLTAGESAFSIAQKFLLGDVLKKVMFPHYLKLLDEARHLPDAKHALALEKQWILPDAPAPLEEKKIEEAQKILQERYTRDYLLEPLKALAADTTIQVSWVENPETERCEARIEHISPATLKALEDLRAKLFEPKAIKDCIDINQLLITAYHAYDSHFDRLQDWHRLEAFAILVIGFILSLVNPFLGKIYCEDFYGVVYENKKISPRAECLTLVDGRPFYRPSRDSQVGQGFNFLCGIFGAASSAGLRGGGSAALIGKLCQANASECYGLTQRVYQRNRRAAEARPPSRCVIS